MITIRSTGEVELSDLASLPEEIEVKLESISGWTEIDSTESVLDGRYTAENLRAIASVMDWHARNEQRSIEMFASPATCGECGQARKNRKG